MREKQRNDRDEVDELRLHLEDKYSLLKGLDKLSVSEKALPSLVCLYP